MVDIFDEVEEELRHERYQQLLRSWGPWVAGAAAAIVAGVAGYQGYEFWRGGVQSRASDAFIAGQEAFEAGRLDAADEAFATLAEEGPRGYATLALMEGAAIALEQGDAARAAQLYEQAAERAPDRLTRDLARYRGVLAGFDDLSYDDVMLRLEPLMGGDAAFGPLARELAGAAAMREARWEEARSHYELLSLALDGSPNQSRRAREALAYIEQNAPAGTAAADEESDA
ncbi:tetratricopeptide repeat protein [Marinicauda salina]|uniref:tetratricopeptide repeat protein n=1 Tax=Marinicauda salina TaxID=2135793 RepID=UPI001304EDB4|nr:tetratricopeptide repeat protein [Marinicauda salina]